MNESKHYGSLDGLRAISCIGIMMMHIQANTAFNIHGFVWEKLIPSFTWLVLLFLMISGFGMCAGYLEKFKNNSVDLETFYKRRYSKILPYFTFLLIIALIVEPSLTNFYDFTLELTLLFGLLPNNSLNVIGVGWTLGAIFVFYLVFPAFTVLLKSKKRAWFAFAISIWINFLIQNYYCSSFFVGEHFTPRHNFLYCLTFFISGGLIYLYRDFIQFKKTAYRILLLSFCIAFSVLIFIAPNKIFNLDIYVYKLFLCYFLWLFYFVTYESKIMSNKVMKFFSNISLEIYLSHMFVFRFFEKLKIVKILENYNGGGYVLLCILVLIGLVCLIQGFKLVQKFILNIIRRITINASN